MWSTVLSRWLLRILLLCWADENRAGLGGRLAVELVLNSADYGRVSKVRRRAKAGSHSLLSGTRRDKSSLVWKINLLLCNGVRVVKNRLV